MKQKVCIDIHCGTAILVQKIHHTNGDNIRSYEKWNRGGRCVACTQAKESEKCVVQFVRSEYRLQKITLR